MMYELSLLADLGRAEGGNLESADNSAMELVPAESERPTPESGAPFMAEDIPAPDCSEKVLAELHEYMQMGVKMIKKRDRDVDESVDSDDDTSSASEGSAKSDNGEPFVTTAFLRQVSELMDKAETLLKEEGAAQDDALKLARELSERFQAIDKGKVDTHQVQCAQVEALLGRVGQLLRMIRPVDLDLLLQLLGASQDAGNTMQDRDVLLLIGTTGSGKTSTIHYLAGSTFEEVVIKGFDHLRILNVAHPALRMSETSSSTRSVTRSVQSIDIKTESGETVAICDSPGFDDTDGVEIDIANGFGLVKAIHRAKRVKPVLILSKSGIGDRFGAVSQVLRTISRLVTGDAADAPVDPSPFAYAFTKYDVKYANRLCKQFRQKRKELTDAEREDASFSALVHDIARKTKPIANIITPLNTGNRASLLAALMEGEWYDDPKASFSPFVSESSLDKIKLQLQLSCYAVQKAIDRKDVPLLFDKLRQLVELGHLLPVAATFARQGLNHVSAFLVLQKQYLSNCIEKCLSLCDNESSFNQELRTAKGIVEVLVSFHPVSSRWMDNLEAGPDFCARSIAILTDGLEEAVFSRSDDMAGFIAGLRKKKQEVILRLCCLKDVANVFGSLSHVVPRPMNLYQKCSDAVIIGIDTVLKRMHERILSSTNSTHFMPNSFLCALEADFELIFFSLGALKFHGLILSNDHQRCIDLAHNAVAAFVLKFQVKFKEITVTMLPSDKTLEEMVGIDYQETAEVRRVLDFFVNNPAFSSHLGKMNACASARKLQELDSAVVCFIGSLVDKVEAEFSIAKEDEDEARLQDIAQILAKADAMCTFYRKSSRELSHQCDDQSKRLAVLGKSLNDQINSLSTKHRTMLEQAKHYLRVIETREPTSILFDIAAAWDEWEIACAQAPKKEKPGMLKKFLSAIGVASSDGSSPDDPDFVRQLKEIKLKIGQKLQLRLARVCRDFSSPSSILFLVKIVAMETRGLALVSWIIKPLRVYNNTQLRLLQYLESFSVLNIFQTGHFSVLSHTLDNLREYAATWSQIKKVAQRIESTNDSQHQLRRSLLALKDYSAQCQDLAAQVLSLQSAFCNITFLDDNRAASVNEHDRNTFYREVASKLTTIDSIGVLHDHLSDEVDLPHLQKASLDHIENQMRSIYEYLTKLISVFPDVRADFKRLYVWRSNLHSIEGCFETAEPKIAGAARRFREDIDREMVLSLKNIASDQALPRNASDLVPLLLVLKEASIHILCWRSAINQAIDELLLSIAKKAPNSGQFILDIELELKNVDGTSKDLALQILSEHKCFEGAMNAVFNSATARQGIDYVIDSLNLSGDAQAILRSMYTAFQEQYKLLIEKGLLAFKSDTLTTYFQDIVNAAKVVANDYGTDYRSQLISLTANIFAHWSLKSMNSFVSGTMSNANTASAAIEYLMRPHAAQVVAIWSLLNFQHNEYRFLQNHFIEILTGEGKSIALGVTATILAMMECDVVCVCYSDYLSSRDYEAFQSMFKDFGTLPSIKYSTVKDACNDLYNKGGDTRRLSRDIAWGKQTECNVKTEAERAQVLLIDEVDVFFKRDFYGEIYSSAEYLQHCVIQNLLKYIWANRHSLNHLSLSMSPQAQACLDLFPVDIQPIISKHMETMLRDANDVDSHNYIVCDGKICYKELDGLTNNISYDYLTTFASMKEHEAGRVTQYSMESYLNIYLKCGQASYAEIPNTFDTILGVTGTLMSLSQNEKDILSNQYGIDKMTYIPSVYGKNKLLFAGDNAKDVIIADDDANFYLELRSEISIRQKPDIDGGPLRAVMAFFESREELEAFYESEQMLDLKPVVRVITEEIALCDKEGAFLQATRSGAITLMIREFGRGTDFKCFDGRMINGGGVHVVQAFFSTEIAEEIQIKGRTARQGAKGSYSMVLKATSLTENLGLTSSDIDSMRLQSKLYSHLDSVRSEVYTQMCDRRKDMVKEAERCHYETIDYKQNALDGKRGNALTYLEKWNGVASRSTPRAVATKAAFISKKRARVASYQERERSKRREAKAKKAHHNASANKPMRIEDETYYDMLGVPTNADVGDIERAFRRVSLSCHPDRCHYQNARDRFNKLTMVKETLCCPNKRRAYDAELRRNTR